MNEFVVSRREAGLGDAIVSLIPAWHYARKTGRTLVIDWRNSFYLKDRRQNVFPLFFEALDEIGGVPVISDERVNQIQFPSSILARDKPLGYLEVASDWIYQKVFGLEMPYTFFWADAQRYELALLKAEETPQREYVLFKTCVSDGLPGLEACHVLLEHLRPLPHIQAKIDRFVEQHFSGKPVLALHVRHGNGGDIMAHSKHWVDKTAAYREMCNAISLALEEMGPDTRIFLCSDGIEVVNILKESFPQILIRDKYFRESGSGELHGKGVAGTEHAEELGEDALIEMFLLARADRLLCYPPGSFFSFYARTCKDGPGTIKELSALSA